MRMAKHLYTRRCPSNRFHVQATGPQMHDNTHFPACGAPRALAVAKALWQWQRGTCATSPRRAPCPPGQRTVARRPCQRCIVARMNHTGGALM